ncbi:MAG: SpoIIE family protein phosphatase [Armatimonadetes bacterium]|nr:SpoIIE family protein phosphatase [Armatimonadota bacterium]
MKPPLPPLSELLPRDLLSRLQADCATLIGGTTVTFRADGSSLTDLFTVSPYCRQVVSSAAGQTLCVQSRRDLALEAIQTGQSQQATCHAGVCMIAVPMMMAGEAVAATVASLSPNPENRDAVFDIARIIQVDPRTLLATTQRAAPLPPDRIKSAIRLLEDLHRLYCIHLSVAMEREQIRHQVTQSARNTKVLYNASRAITSTMSLDQTVRLLVEQMAHATGLDRCLIALREDVENSLKPGGAYGLTPQESQRFHEARTLDLGIRPEWWDRLRQGRVVRLPLGWLNQTPIKEIFPVSSDRRGLLAPVVSGGTLRAVAYLDGARDADSLTQQETDLLLTIAGQAGIAIAHIYKFEQEQRVARILQESLQTTLPLQIGSLSIGSLYQPALAEAQVGGDFYDLFAVDDHRYAVLIGDVSGKGVRAAVHTGMIKYTTRALVVEDPTPATLVSRVNRAIARQDVLDSNFITFFYALADLRDNRLHYTNAGHEHPLLYHAHMKKAIDLPPSGPAIGLLDDFEYEQDERPFLEGDCLLLYTDGAVEARNPQGQFYELDGLKKSFLKAVDKDGPQIVTAIHQELKKFTMGVLQDDLALLALKQAAEGKGNRRGN